MLFKGATLIARTILLELCLFCFIKCIAEAKEQRPIGSNKNLKRETQ